MRKIGIKLQDRAGRSEAGRCPRGSNTTHEGRIELAGLQWLPPPRQLPFRWKCDGCPLFRMIKYRRKNGDAQAETWGPPVVFCNHANRAPENLRSLPPLLCLPSFLFPSFDKPFSYPLPLLSFEGLSIVNGRKTEGRNSNAIFIYLYRGIRWWLSLSNNARGILNLVLIPIQLIAIHSRVVDWIATFSTPPLPFGIDYRTF